MLRQNQWPGSGCQKNGMGESDGHANRRNDRDDVAGTVDCRFGRRTLRQGVRGQLGLGMGHCPATGGTGQGDSFPGYLSKKHQRADAADGCPRHRRGERPQGWRCPILWLRAGEDRIRRLARHAQGSAVEAGSSRALTFGGSTSAVLVPGAQIYSDPVAYDVAAQTDLAVSLYLSADSGPPTAHAVGLRSAWLAPGDQASAAQLQGATSLRSYLWLAGIDVNAASKASTIVAFGDSITDGFSTTPDADTPWPSILARRLSAQRGMPPRAVINMGISGNRVLKEGAGSSALARFDRDVLSRPGVRWVLLLEGINDIGFSAIPGLPASEKVTADEIIAGYRLLIGRAHLHGLKIIGGTLTPFEGVNTYTAAGEDMRQQVNRWIRESGAFDAVVDFDAATRDPAVPTKLRAQFDSGDHIHPNDAGNQAMADAIDLKLFR